ncbi:MAG: hypothetical protein ACLU6Z_04180 [Odoribacter splanchnicus]
MKDYYQFAALLAALTIHTTSVNASRTLDQSAAQAWSKPIRGSAVSATFR